MVFFSSIQSSLQRRQAASGSEKSPASAKTGATATLQKILHFHVITVKQRMREEQKENRLKLGHGCL
jgi:hypothetical protein